MASLHDTLRHIDQVPFSAAREVLALAVVVFVYKSPSVFASPENVDPQGEEALAELLLKVTQKRGYRVLQVQPAHLSAAGWLCLIPPHQQDRLSWVLGRHPLNLPAL